MLRMTHKLYKIFIKKAVNITFYLYLYPELICIWRMLIWAGYLFIAAASSHCLLCVPYSSLQQPPYVLYRASRSDCPRGTKTILIPAALVTLRVQLPTGGQTEKDWLNHIVHMCYSYFHNIFFCCFLLVNTARFPSGMSPTFTIVPAWKLGGMWSKVCRQLLLCPASGCQSRYHM